MELKERYEYVTKTIDDFDDGRFYTQHPWYDPIAKQLVATNGHCLHIAKFELPAETFPKPTFVSRSIDGLFELIESAETFPDYHAIIPSDLDVPVVVDMRDLKRALLREEIDDDGHCIVTYKVTMPGGASFNENYVRAAFNGHHSGRYRANKAYNAENRRHPGEFRPMGTDMLRAYVMPVWKA